MHPTILIFSIVLILSSCARPHAQPAVEPRLVGGPCEGCEAVFEYGEQSLSAVDTLEAFATASQPIRISGTVFKSDGKTPASGVIVYVYHTNEEGIYENKYGAADWGRRHGYLRTWLKTDEKGRYAFYTCKPGTYPSRTEPAHIHYTVLEPDGKYYWLHSIHFTGDPLLTEKETHPENPRGGFPGLVELKKKSDLWEGQWDIILGKNIPGY